LTTALHDRWPHRISTAATDELNSDCLRAQSISEYSLHINCSDHSLASNVSQSGRFELLASPSLSGKGSTSERKVAQMATSNLQLSVLRWSDMCFGFPLFSDCCQLSSLGIVDVMSVICSVLISCNKHIRKVEADYSTLLHAGCA
jgi:hypothetical protein